MRIFFFNPNLIFILNKKKTINGDRIYYLLISPRAQYIYACIALVISALTMKTKSEAKL